MFASKDVFFTNRGGGYTIARSVRLRSSASAYFNRTPASAGNRKTWTFSFWFKRGKLGASQSFMDTRPALSDSQLTNLYINASDVLVIGGYNTDWRITTQVFRDPSAWYHGLIVLDTTQATASNRWKLYINGSQVTSFTTSNDPTLNADLGINQASATAIGALGNGASSYYDGYLTEINFIDGQALTPSSFGQTNSVTGVWQPIKYTGTYGTNGFYLNFGNNASTTTLGYDTSGNSNNWTTNNISLTAGSTYDSMTDVPTLTSSTQANYPTFSPIDTGGGSVTLSGGNLNYSIASSTGSQVRGTMGTDLTGKWYFEFTAGSVASPTNPQMFGLSTTQGQIVNNQASLRKAVYAYFDAGTNHQSQYVLNGVTQTINPLLLNSAAIGDILQIAYDAATGKVWFGKNNTWYDSANGATGNPSAGTNQTITIATGDSMTPFVCNLGATYSGSLNCGQQPFTYTPPTGFVALNTYNLPTPTISNGANYMAASTYTANASTQTIVNSGNNPVGISFQPDLVWTKSRTGAYSHELFDVNRGVNAYIGSNNTNAEVVGTAQLTSFNSNGFTLGANENSNYTNGYAAVAWQWKASGSTVSNTSGSITSTVSAGATQGFSVVTYTGTGANATVGHGLGVAPSMIICKSRSSTYNWVVYHVSLGNTANLKLNTTDAQTTGATTSWNSTSPTSTVFSLGSSLLGNDTNPMVAYCFAAVAGYSAFGSYTGNGSTDGTFVYLGFRPRYVMIKRTDVANDWELIDTSRSPYNVSQAQLAANDSRAELANVNLDVLSNGFKLRESLAWGNASGGTYIYMAFAENPFKNSLAR